MMRIPICALSALLLAACREPAAPPSGVEVSVVATPTRIAPGQNLSVLVRVSNSSSITYEVPGSAGGCFAVLGVRRGRSRVAAYDDRLCDAVAAFHPLSPNGALEDRLVWALPTSGLDPGTYQVRAAVGIRGHGSFWSREVAVEVER